MVGSVLMERMRAEGDFNNLPGFIFFSTSDVGGQGPVEADGPLENAKSIDSLKKCGAIVTCQGGAWTSDMYPKMKAAGWNGIWIDAASTLRMEENSIIVLDPINKGAILSAYKGGFRTFVGGNCTVSLMLMACQGLFKNNLVEWMWSATYQAASGAGAAHMQELIRQMGVVSNGINLSDSALAIDRLVTKTIRSDEFPKQNFKAPLACSLIPWIDQKFSEGQTREEWKSSAEGNKILERNSCPIPIDGLCVRVGAMRCHSQALLIKLTKDIPLAEITEIIATANEWVKVIPNEMAETVYHLTPAFISGKLDVAIGRIHKAKMGPQYLSAFTVGDQLLWGAAEPLRRTLNILFELV